MEPDNRTQPCLVWDWALEHEDRKKEAKADASVHGAPPFQVDRKLLKDIVREKMGIDVARITYLGAGVYYVADRVPPKIDVSPPCQVPSTRRVRFTVNSSQCLVTNLAV